MAFSQIEKVLQTVEERRDEIIGLARELVKTPSENKPPDGDELACQKIIREFFRKANLKTDFVHLKDVPGLKDHEAYLTGRNYKNRPNVTAAYEGSGKWRSLLLSGHIDTMPAGEEEKWKHARHSSGTKRWECTWNR